MCCVPDISSLGPWCDGKRCPGGQTCDYSTNPRGNCIPDIGAIDCLDASAQKVLYIDKAPWSPTNFESRECIESNPNPGLCYPIPNSNLASCSICDDPSNLEYFPPGYGIIKEHTRTCEMNPWPKEIDVAAEIDVGGGYEHT